MWQMIAKAVGGAFKGAEKGATDYSSRNPTNTDPLARLQELQRFQSDQRANQTLQSPIVFQPQPQIYQPAALEQEQPVQLPQPVQTQMQTQWQEQMAAPETGQNADAYAELLKYRSGF